MKTPSLVVESLPFEANDVTISTAQIGKSGELLVQYRLLLLGIESPPMSTDTGVDLVAYSPHLQQAITIQVKINLKPKPGGGGKLASDWWIRDDSPAHLVALVDLQAEKVWLFRHEELAAHAQQKSSGRLHFYMDTDPAAKPRTGRLSHAYEFEKFIISNRVTELFGLPVGRRQKLLETLVGADDF